MSAPAETVVQLLSECVDECPERVYLDFGGERHTYAGIWERAAGFAATLAELGVGPGDTVAAMLPNSADAVALWFATNMTGGIWAGVNTGLKGSFLAHVLRDIGARVVACEAGYVDRFDHVGEIPEMRHVLVRGALPLGTASVERICRPLLGGSVSSAPLAWRTADSEDLTCLVYTGGTTGPSKGCAISHGYAFSAAQAFHHQSGRTQDEVNWSPLPIFHFNLLSGTVLGTMALQSTAAIAERFSVRAFWPEVERSGARIVNLLGSMGWMIAQADDAPESERCRGQVRMVHGVPFPPDLQAIWKERFDVAVVGTQTYGSTEAFPQTTLEVGRSGPSGSSGRVNGESFDVTVVDDRDEPVPAGHVGEVVCRPRRSNVMFSGYWRNPQATVDATANLWFHTGDLGRFDADGWFYFVDRKTDYLRRRGENISSQEVEAVYLQHPDIAAVAVHAVPSEYTEDDVKVTGVLKPDSKLTEEELFDWSTAVIPDYALPRYIEFRAELPVSPVGRVHKFQLRDEGCTPTTWDRGPR